MDTYQFSKINPASALAFSPGSTFIATAHNDVVSIRLTTSLEPVRTWTCDGPESSPSWTIDSLQWSATGTKILAHAARIQTAWAFDLTGGQSLCRLTNVDRVEWGSDVIAAWSDGGISLHEITSGTSRFIQNVQNACSWSPDRRYLAVVERHQGKDHIGVYDQHSLVRHFAIPTVETAGLLWSPCGKWFAVWDWRLNYSLYIYSPVGAQLGHFQPDADTDTHSSIQNVRWSPNGRILLIGDNQGFVRMLESESWSTIATLHICESSGWFETSSGVITSAPKLSQFARGNILAMKGPIDFLDFNPEGDSFFVGHNNVLQIYDLKTSQTGPLIDVQSSIRYCDPIKCVAWCPTIDRLAVVTRSRILYLWDRLGAEGVDVPENGEFAAHSAHWAPDGRSIAISAKHSYCVVYDDGPGDNAWEELP